VTYFAARVHHFSRPRSIEVSHPASSSSSWSVAPRTPALTVANAGGYVGSRAVVIKDITAYFLADSVCNCPESSTTRTGLAGIMDSVSPMGDDANFITQGATMPRVDGPVLNTGIYSIRNIFNGKRYVGQASGKRGFKARWSEHKLALRRGTHDSPHLQAAYDQDGLEAFEFIIEERCRRVPEVCDKLEQFYMDNVCLLRSAERL
jgi:hypothetical protein